jgi:hypothetical protein
MRSFLILLTAFLLAGPTRGQSTEDSIKAVINNLFTGMRNADASLVKGCFGDSSILQTIGRTREGQTMVRNERIADFAEFVGQLKKDSADERISFDVIRIDGPLASVWTPYQFYFNGTFSHCGVNSFQLIRFGGAWKIHYLVDTRRRQGCQ